ncbi:MAG: two-component sensor histidine kinase [Deltaproteobacteria bacterium]|nr:two-component sensor histidine kinase [Deltaproteobacteria bacterium]
MIDQEYRRLKAKIIVTTLCFSLIPLFVLGATIYYQFHTAYSSIIIQDLRAMADNRKHAIDLFFDERISQLTTLAHTCAFDQLSQGEFLERLFNMMQSRSKSFIDIGVIDENGDHVAYVGPYNLKGVNYRNETWFHSVMLRGAYVSDVFLGFRKFPHIIIAVLRREGERSWILRASIDTDLFETMVKAAQLGEKGDAFLLNRDNVFQTTPRFEGKLLDHSQVNFNKYEGTRVESTDIRGRNTLLATTWLKNKDWLLVIKEDTREELTPLVYARLLAVWVIFGGIAVIVAGTVFMARLMTGQLIQSERQKAVLDANLEQSSKMAALGKLAAGIAHEVNNPLAVIKEKVGWAKDLLAEEDIQQSENFKEFLDAVEKIDQHVERAKNVTHRLLGFARRMEPVQEEVDINKILTETIALFSNESRFRNISIFTEFTEPLPRTLSDSSQLQQVFLNIINNAIDAINKDGRITVTTGHNSVSKELCVEIFDTGPGISKELLNKIFDPFFTTKAVGKGTGLGLSISYSIMERLGGRLTAESGKDRGTVFSIYLPVK